LNTQNKNTAPVKKIFLNFQFLFLVGLDQITKLLFGNRDFFLGPIHFHPVKNYGLVFSLNFGLLANIILISFGLIYFAVYYYRRREFFSYPGELMFVLIFAGAISNIIDRLYLSYVRDFLDLGLGFTFNLADVFVVIGLLLFVYLSDGDKFTN
jgi:signal peptidase II